MKALTWLLLLCWTYSWALCPAADPEPVQVKLKHDLLFELALQPDALSQQLTLRELKFGRLQTQQSLADLGISSHIQAQPLLEDLNLDGLTDHLWFVGIDGKIWRLPVYEGELGEPRLMADLADSGLHFIATAALLRTRLPTSLAPVNWRQADQYLVLLIGRDSLSGQDRIVVLRFGLNMLQRLTLRFNELTDRTLYDYETPGQQLSATDWRALLSDAGWYLALPGKVSATPTVAAGILYAPVAPSLSTTDCNSQTQEQLLFALQVHTAGPIYAKRSLPVPFISQGQLTLRQQPDKSISLLLRTEQQQVLLLANLLKLNGECHNCTEPLSLAKYPLWQRLATFRSEQGGY